MQMSKFISYIQCGIVKVKLSQEFNADVIPCQVKHAHIITWLAQQGTQDKDLLSYGSCLIIGDKIKVVHNDYFYSYAEKKDAIINNKILIEWSKVLNKELAHEMR